MTLIATPLAAPVSRAAIASQDQPHHIQLDGIRALAVMGVMLEHYFPQTEFLQTGTIGVRIFFVLSGFLITGILLRARDASHASGGTRPRVLRQFYIRRFLRIFPLFYGVLLAAELIGLPDVRQSFGWHVLYLSNFYNFFQNDHFNSVSHLWSLAVEEQFYLVWPIIILFLPRRAILPTTVAGILMGPLFRAAMLSRGFSIYQTLSLTPSAFDMLGCGALLAELRHDADETICRSVLSVAAVSGAVLFPICLIGAAIVPSNWWIIPDGLTTALCAMWLIDGAYDGFDGFAGAFLRFEPLVFLGLISYGAYVMHNLVGGVATRVLNIIGLHEQTTSQRALCMFVLTLIAAGLSWQFYEKPINQLKRFFPYTSRTGT